MTRTRKDAPTGTSGQSVSGPEKADQERKKDDQSIATFIEPVQRRVIPTPRNVILIAGEPPPGAVRAGVFAALGLELPLAESTKVVA